MSNSHSFLGLYSKLVLSRPKTVVLILLAVFAILGHFSKDFRLDASADSLILEHDEDLRYFRKIISRYETSDFLLLTYTPHEDLFSKRVLDNLKKLRDELKQMGRVASVITILDVPLLRSPPISLKEIRSAVKNLESPDVDLKLARVEFVESPIYQKMLVSPDMQTTALVINFAREKKYEDVVNRLSDLNEKKYKGTLTPAEASEQNKLSGKNKQQQDRMRTLQHEDIVAVRKIMDSHRSEAALFLGGVPMVIDDMISFIKSDLKVFGLGMLCFLVLTLGVVFKKLRWVFLPMFCCAFSTVVMFGFLGIFGWEVTVISSNFVSLQLIITMSFTIHLIVRYRELLRDQPEIENRDLIRESVRVIFLPCLFSCTTTIAGFISLLVCDILPVINFGWMMVMGLCVSLIVTFTFFPAGLLCLPKTAPDKERPIGVFITSFFARITEKYGKTIFATALAMTLLIGWGVSRLEVENSFINYFKSSTEIYRGMQFIDRELGGTYPLDIVVNFKDIKPKQSEAVSGAKEDTDFNAFEEFKETTAQDTKRYWFTQDKLELIKRIHDHLDRMEETGKVLSLATMLKVASQLYDGRSLDNFELALLFNELPQEYRKILVDPYVSVKDNQARISIRIVDSLKTLHRDAFLKKVQSDLLNKLSLEKDQFRLTGMIVLYNNMLQSLFSAQIKTIGLTVLMLMAMFMVLFRSLKISIIAIIPNLLASLSVLGVLGLTGTPLDMMTITIVAVSVGIAVDNTIHYIYRFKREFSKNRSYLNTMYRCHGSIGNAMFYTSLTIIIGFSILSLSNFIPTIYFGLLTGFAMTVALVAALTLLPRLIVVLKPFGPEGEV